MADRTIVELNSSNAKFSGCSKNQHFRWQSIIKSANREFDNRPVALTAKTLYLIDYQLFAAFFISLVGRLAGPFDFTDHLSHDFVGFDLPKNFWHFTWAYSILIAIKKGFISKWNNMILSERKHYHGALDEDRYLMIKYVIESSLGVIENYRYRQKILGKIMLQDEQGKDLEEIGRLYADKLLFDIGVDEGWDHFSIFDTEQYLMDLGSVVWDFERNDFSLPLLKFFHHDLIDMDILYIHTIEILPGYRGMQIGEHAMKDAANNFEQGCSLVVTDCLPLQHTNWGKKDKEWRKKMRYDLLEKGKRKAKQQVIQYLKRTGFYYLPKVSKQYMFLCPARRNPNFDYIELE